MNQLYAIGGIVIALIGVGFWLYTRGRAARAGDDARASNKVKDEQLEALTKAPKTPQDLADHLRKGGQF